MSFDVEILNVGGAMNSTSGIFTAPWDGIYSFSFTGLAWLPASSSRIRLIVQMYLNGNAIGNGYADEDAEDDEDVFLPMDTQLAKGRSNLVADL